jgi:hypothetical protein
MDLIAADEREGQPVDLDLKERVESSLAKSTGGATFDK